MQSTAELARLLRSCGLADPAQHLLSMPRPEYVRAIDFCFAPSFAVGASAIDDAIGGGMYPGLLYEVVGPGGSGKTQFGLQCLLQSLLTLPPPTICAYICTEKSVPMLRLRALASAFAARHALKYDPLDRILVHTAHSFRELEGIVLTQLPSLPSRSSIPGYTSARVGCVVIDSICGFSRDLDQQWLGADAAQKRATALGRMAQVGPTCYSFMRIPSAAFSFVSQALKAFACDQRCVVVGINQVAVRMRDDADDAPSADSNVAYFSSDKGLSPEVFSASISFSPAEYPGMSPAAAAAGLCHPPLAVPHAPSHRDCCSVAQFHPALGPTWQHNVNVRIVIARDELGGRVAVIGECAADVMLERCQPPFHLFAQARALGCRPLVQCLVSLRMVYVEVEDIGAADCECCEADPPLCATNTHSPITCAKSCTVRSSCAHPPVRQLHCRHALTSPPCCHIAAAACRPLTHAHARALSPSCHAPLIQGIRSIPPSCGGRPPSRRRVTLSNGAPACARSASSSPSSACAA